MEYHGKFGHTLGQIQNVALLSRIDIFCIACILVTQTVSPTLPGLQVIKLCIQYLDSHPHKPILCPYNSHDDSNVIIITYSCNQVEDYTTHNCL